MSVRVLLDHAALRLDRDRNETDRVLLCAHRHADIERLFGAIGIIDRPDRRYRYRAFVPLDRIEWAFGREIVDKLTNTHLPKPSPARQKAYNLADAALAQFKDDRPWPARVPVLRSDWHTAPADSRYEERLPLSLTLSEEDYRRLRLGFRPGPLDEPWFMFFEEPWLYIHTNWSGFLIARLRIGNGIEEIVLNLDPTQTAVSDNPLMPVVYTLSEFLNIVIPDPEDAIAQWHEHGERSADKGPRAGIDPASLIASS